MRKLGEIFPSREVFFQREYWNWDRVEMLWKVILPFLKTSLIKVKSNGECNEGLNRRGLKITFNDIEFEKELLKL